MLTALQCISLFTSLAISTHWPVDFKVIEKKGKAYIERSYSIPYVEQLPGVIDARLQYGRIKMIESMKRGGVLLFIDVNNLNKINKLFHRDTGDAYIVSVVSEIQKLIGEKGEIYRLGGDEFTVVLKSISPDEIQTLIVAIEKAVAKNSQATLKPAILFKGQILQLLKSNSAENSLVQNRKLDDAFRDLIARYARASVSTGAAYINPRDLKKSQEKAEYRARMRKIAIKILAGLSVEKYGSTHPVDQSKKPAFVLKSAPDLIPVENYKPIEDLKIPSNVTPISGQPDAKGSYVRYNHSEFEIIEKLDEFYRATFWIRDKTSISSPLRLLHSSAVTQLPSINTIEGQAFDRKFAEPQNKNRARIEFKFAGLMHFNYLKDGVESGDRALRLIGSLLESHVKTAIEQAIKTELRSHLRENDMVFSGMGSDFIVFLENVPQQVALEIQRRLVQSVANSPAIHDLIQSELTQLETDPSSASLVPKLRAALDPAKLIESTPDQFRYFQAAP